MMLNALYVALGGGIGAALRYLTSSLVTRLAGGFTWAAAMPLGTLAVNVIGCLVIGFLAPTLASLVPARPKLTLFLVTGVLGGFTTMSSFSNETLTLFQSGQQALAIGYAVGTFALCMCAVAIGAALAGFVVRQ